MKEKKSSVSVWTYRSLADQVKATDADSRAKKGDGPTAAMLLFLRAPAELATAALHAAKLFEIDPQRGYEEIDRCLKRLLRVRGAQDAERERQALEIVETGAAQRPAEKSSRRKAKAAR